MLNFSRVKIKKEYIILGTQKSGKSLLSQILQYNNIIVQDEQPSQYKEMYIAAYNWHFKKDDSIKILLKKQLKSKNSFFANTVFIPTIDLLDDMLKDVRFIHIHRNPLSQIFEWYTASNLHRNNDHLKKYRYYQGNGTILEKCCFEWNLLNSLILEKTKNKRFLQLSYDDLVMNKLSKLEHFINVKNINYNQINYKRTQISQNYYWTKKEFSTISGIVDQTAKKLKYDLKRENLNFNPEALLFRTKETIKKFPIVKKFHFKIKKVLHKNKTTIIFDKAYVISFPKTGRTWLKVMLTKVLHGVKSSNVNKNLSLLNFVHTASKPIKGYSTSEKIKDDYSKLISIFLLRDPRDTIVSYYFEKSKRSKVPFKGSISEFIRHQDYGIHSVIKFYNDWYEKRYQFKQTTYFRYEDFKKKPVEELMRFLQFIGYYHKIGERVVKDAVNFSSFENMRKQELENKSILNDKSLSVSHKANIDDKDSYKTRKGIVGGYVEYLTDDDIEYCNKQLIKLHPDIAYEI